MKFVGEKNVKMVDMAFDMSDDEADALELYGRRHIDRDSLIGWAARDMLSKYVMVCKESEKLAGRKKPKVKKKTKKKKKAK